MPQAAPLGALPAAYSSFGAPPGTRFSRELRARSSAAPTVHRTVIQYRLPLGPPSAQKKNTDKSVFFFWCTSRDSILARTARSVFRGSDSPPDCHSVPLPLRAPVGAKKRTPTYRCSSFGAPPGTRTLDPLIKSQLLYQLS